MKNAVFFMLFILLWLPVFSQSGSFTPKEKVFVGPNREIKSLAKFFEEDRKDIHVLVDEGDYYSEQAINIRGENIILEGTGEVRLYCTVLYENVMWVISSNNIIVKNFHMKHLMPGEPESQNCSGRVIGFDNASNVTIENCDLNGCGLAGLHDNLGNSNILVKECWIHDNTLGAYTDIDGNVWMEAIDDHPVFRFVDNKIENNGSDEFIEGD